MYDKTLTNRRGDDINIDADKGRDTVFITIKDFEAPEGVLISLNEQEFNKLRYMLTEAYCAMEW